MVAAAALAILGIVAYAVANETPVERAEAIPPVSIPDPLEVYDPVRAGETLPEGYRSALPRDAILPVYEPAFTRSQQRRLARRLAGDRCLRSDRVQGVPGDAHELA